LVRGKKSGLKIVLRGTTESRKRVFDRFKTRTGSLVALLLLLDHRIISSSSLGDQAATTTIEYKALLAIRRHTMCYLAVKLDSHMLPKNTTPLMTSPSSPSSPPTTTPRVRFQDADYHIIDDSSSSSYDSESEICEPTPSLWYRQEDLELFRNEARELCRQMRPPAMKPNSDTTSGKKTVGQLLLARDWATRGLEQRCCLERQRRKYLANRCIVRASQHMHPDELARLTIRCTAWAASLAREEGKRDVLRAYPLTSQAETVAVQDGACFVTKRRCTVAGDDRRVRPRLISIETD
jgi:hypothetical protein